MGDYFFYYLMLGKFVLNYYNRYYRENYVIVDLDIYFVFVLVMFENE